MEEEVVVEEAVEEEVVEEEVVEVAEVFSVTHTAV